MEWDASDNVVEQEVMKSTWTGANEILQQELE
jgi:hypothetical protein